MKSNQFELKKVDFLSHHQLEDSTIKMIVEKKRKEKKRKEKEIMEIRKEIKLITYWKPM